MSDYNMKHAKMTVPSSCSVKINGSSAKCSVSASANFSIDGNKMTALVKKKEDALIEAVRLDKEGYELQKKLIEIDNGEERFKAKFFRASLGSSKEGKELLVMLDQVKQGIKLLK